MDAKGEKIGDLDFWIILLYFVLIVSTFALITSIMNLKFLRPLVKATSQKYLSNSDDFVSILIPARNEANRIGECLSSITSQNFEQFEVIVLDDRSSDATAEIVETFIESNSMITLLQGQHLPEGWIGKNWACHQLSGHARGRMLLFMDADTVLVDSNVLSKAVSELKVKEADLITLMPDRDSGSIVERFMYVFIDWILFSMMPVNLAHKSSNMYLCLTFGQFMLFRRSTFEFIGGYLGIYDNLLDDFTLGRLIKNAGFKWMLFDGTNCVKVQPYAGNIEALKSISRSIFPAFNYSLLTFLSFAIIVFSIGLFPIIIIVVNNSPNFLSSPLGILSFLAYFMNLSSWLIACFKFRHNFLFGFLNPVATVLMIVVALHSIFSYCLRITTWKGRNIMGFKLRL